MNPLQNHSNIISGVLCPHHTEKCKPQFQISLKEFEKYALLSRPVAKMTDRFLSSRGILWQGIMMGYVSRDDMGIVRGNLTIDCEPHNRFGEGDKTIGILLNYQLV